MDVETHEILFSFDQPVNVLSSLLATVQQVLAQQKTRSGKSVPLYETHRVLIIDMQLERASYLVQVLSLAGYRSLAVGHSLEAFTLFLQGTYMPLLVIQGQDDPAKRFFLQRLLQQMVQKFDVEVPLVRLVTQSSSFSGEQPRVPSAPGLEKTGAGFATFAPGWAAPILVPETVPLPPLPTQQPFPEAVNGYPVAGVSASSVQSSDIQSGPLSASGRQMTPSKPLAPPKKQVKISLTGQSLGRYQIEEVIGKGPLGDVYRVYDRLRENRVALKVVQTDMVPYFSNDTSSEEEHIFQAEAALTTRLKHPHIAPVLNTGKSYISGTSFVYKTMPYYAEGSLTQWLYEHGGQRARGPQEIIPLILQLADALQYAHDQQILFQNFKPNNMLVKEPAKAIDQIELLLTDFSVLDESLPLSEMADLFSYMAPERWDGAPQPASDQYALAVYAYELLTGRSLFQGNTGQIMKRLHHQMHPQAPSTLNPALSVQASNVLMKALAKRPEERFASVGLFAQTLQRFSF